MSRIGHNNPPPDEPEWMRTFATAPDGYVYRDARPEDGMVLEGIAIEHQIIGGTMEKDGAPVAYAGVNKIGNHHYAFFFIADDEIRRHGLWIVRLMRDSIRMCRQSGITELLTLCDKTKPHAEAFLRTLGFQPMDEYDKPVDVLIYEKLMGAKAWRRIERA